MRRKYKTTVEVFNGGNTEPTVIEKNVAAINKIDANKKVLSKFNINSVLKIKSVLFVLFLFINIIVNAQTVTHKGIKFTYTNENISKVTIDKTYFINKNYNSKQVLRTIKKYATFKNSYYEKNFHNYMNKVLRNSPFYFKEEKFKVTYLVTNANSFIRKVSN